MSDDKRAEVELRLQRVDLQPWVPPKWATNFHIVRIGPQIIFEAGHVGVQELQGALQAVQGDTQPPEVPLFISDRFIVDLVTLRRLRDMLKRFNLDDEGSTESSDPQDDLTP